MGVMVLGLYISSRYNPFMVDDHVVIVNNPAVTEPGRFTQRWTDDLMGRSHEGQTLQQPFTIVTYKLNVMFNRLSPLAFRLVNIMLLGVVGCLVAVWLSQYALHHAGPWLAAFMFAAHPAQAELINHIVGRAQLLSMAGVLSFLILQRIALDRSGHPYRTSSGQRWLYGAATAVGGFVSSSVAMLSATTGLLLIPLAAAQAVVTPAARYKHRTRAKRAEGPRPWLVHLLVAFCLLAPAGLFGVDRLVATDPLELQVLLNSDQPHDMVINPALDATADQSWPIAFSLAGFYAQQVVWPDLEFNHIPIDLPRWTDRSTWLGVAGVAVMVIGFVVTLIHGHWLALIPVMTLGQWLLVSHLWLRTHLYASNLMVMVFILGAVAPLSWLIDRTTQERGVINRATRDSTRQRAVAVVPCILVILLMAYKVIQVNRTWLSQQRLMASSLENQPNNPVAMYLYGASLIEVQWYDNAFRWLDLALQFRPRSLQILSKLALVEELRFRPKSAADFYERMIGIDLAHVPAYLRLTDLAIQQEDYGEAEKHLTAALRLAPTNPRAMYDHAKLAQLQDEPDEALARYRALLEHHPHHEQARRDLAELEKTFEDPPAIAPG